MNTVTWIYKATHGSFISFQKASYMFQYKGIPNMFIKEKDLNGFLSRIWKGFFE